MENIPESNGNNEAKSLVDVAEIERRIAESRRRSTEVASPRETVKLRSTPTTPRGSTSGGGVSSPRNPTNYEEVYEHVVEEGGMLGGAKVVKFERITLQKTVREVTTPLSSILVREMSRTPSSEHPSRTPSKEASPSDDLDSAYQTARESRETSRGLTSKSSSVTSLSSSRGRYTSQESLGRAPSREQLSGTESPVAPEWYSDYRHQSFQHIAARLEHVRSRSEYDSHIAEIKGER